SIGSPPVILSFFTPSSAYIRAIRSSSSNDRSSSLFMNSKSSPKTSFGMQYLHLKLHRSVTDMRRSLIGLPNLSVIDSTIASPSLEDVHPPVYIYQCIFMHSVRYCVQGCRFPVFKKCPHTQSVRFKLCSQCTGEIRPLINTDQRMKLSFCLSKYERFFISL